MKNLIDVLTPKQRAFILLVIDSLIIIASLISAFSLRFPIDQGIMVIQTYWWLLLLTVAIRIGAFQSYGLYISIWRYASMKELLNVVKAITFSSFIIMSILFIAKGMSFPTSILIVDWAFNIIGIGGVRVMLRLFRDYSVARKNRHQTHGVDNVLIIGAGDAGETIVREMLRSSSHKYKILGFIDDEPRKLGQHIHQIAVLGTTEDIPKLCEKYDIDEAICAIPSLPGHQIRRIMQLCEKSKIGFRVTPGLNDIIDGKVSINQIREVQIEDLLGRDIIKTDISDISKYISGSTVLVTGAGGSIGSELCRQILHLSPSQLLLLDHAENHVYHIDMEIRNMGYNHVTIIPIVADVKNRERLESLFARYKPDLIFHAAAYKHVPLMEENVGEVIQNNIMGTQNILEMAHEHQVKNFVLISTDKAVNSTNCMGASKRACEIMMQSIAQYSQTKFSAVRFGNVLDSDGSVVPLFKKQIARGGPITVTHPDVIRFFMTIPEAVSLVIKAGALCVGGEIFILDMGEPVKILNLAKDMIHLSGLEEDRDIEIKFIGLRPGEKLYEELYFNKEELRKTEHKKIMIAQPPQYNADCVRSSIQALIAQVGVLDPEDLKAGLFNFISSKTPTELSQQKIA